VRELGCEAGAAARDENRIVQADTFAACKDDEWFVLQLAPTDGSCSRQGMFRGNCREQAFLVQEQGMQAEGVAHRDWPGDSDGGLSARDHVPNPFRRALLQFYGHARIAPAEFL